MSRYKISHSFYEDQEAFKEDFAYKQRQKKEEFFTNLISDYIEAVKQLDEDEEMRIQKELKYQFKLTDDQITRKVLNFFYQQKSDFRPALKESVDLSTVKPLTYLMDGWLLKGDVSLTYGSYGSGKTTHALYKAFNFAKGENILDRDAKCKKGKSLFICTDGGVTTFKKAMYDLGIEDDPVFKEGEEQKIFVWGYESSQGQQAWFGNINGIIKLENFVQYKGIDYVVIDSAKSVSSGAFNYLDNVQVREFIRVIRDVIAVPNNVHIEILSHDGTARGAHAGAKSWAEEPSMVISLNPIIDEDTKAQTGVIAEFKKDRAANVEPRRKVIYKLDECEMVLDDQKKIVGSCNDVIMEIMSDFYKQGQKEVRRADIVTTAFNTASAARKTVDNTLGNMVNSRSLTRPRKGVYSLSPKDIQRLELIPDQKREILSGTHQTSVISMN